MTGLCLNALHWALFEVYFLNLNWKMAGKGPRKAGVLRRGEVLGADGLWAQAGGMTQT